MKIAMDDDVTDYVGKTCAIPDIVLSHCIPRCCVSIVVTMTIMTIHQSRVGNFRYMATHWKRERGAGHKTKLQITNQHRQGSHEKNTENQ